MWLTPFTLTRLERLIEILYVELWNSIKVYFEISPGVHLRSIPPYPNHYSILNHSSILSNTEVISFLCSVHFKSNWAFWYFDFYLLFLAHNCRIIPGNNYLSHIIWRIWTLILHAQIGYLHVRQQKAIEPSGNGQKNIPTRLNAWDMSTILPSKMHES